MKTQQDGQFTIISVPAAQKIDSSFFKENVETFLSEDDVFSRDFLYGVVFLRHRLAESNDQNGEKETPPKEEIDLERVNEKWRILVREWNIKWMTSISSSVEIPEWPYLSDKTGNHEAWRVYDDINNAFVLSIWPSSHQSQPSKDVEFQNTQRAGYATRSLGE